MNQGVVRFAIDYDETDIELDGFGAPVETVVQTSFDDGQIHRVIH